MRYFGGCLFLLLLFAAPGFAQFYPTQYRPPNLHWQQLQTDHFRIVYPEGEDSVAWRTGYILESQFEDVKTLTGGSFTDFPVVLTNYSDLSNGFVTTLHFRSEVQVAPIKGKALNPRSGNWLEAVEPHELVHALHFNNIGGFGVSGLLGLFSPDFARSLHGGIPAGITEGLAVQHETEGVASGGGRGHYPYFYNQFNAVFNSPDQWSMGQMSHFPQRTRPFDRHYIGGYEFTSWLHSTYGKQTSRKALNFYKKLPFLGYGVALRHATGRWPGQLYEEFESTKEKSAGGGIRASKSEELQPLSIPYEGASIRAPRWLDPNTLIFYGSFYNARPGFYRYNLDSQQIKIVAVTNSVDDFSYDIAADRSRILYSFFDADPIYNHSFLAELREINLDNGTSQKLTNNGRIYGPQYLNENSVLALQTHHASSRIVRYEHSTGNIQTLADLGKHQVKEVAVHPRDSGRLAAVINKRGMQGLWLANMENLEEHLQAAPEVSFMDGTIFDIEWHPEGDRLLFTADIDGAMNIYEYDLSDRKINRITDTRLNAYEGSYSPSGNCIAFIKLKGNETLPGVLDRKNFDGTTIENGRWKITARKKNFMEKPELGEDLDSLSTWNTSSYTSGLSWLAPRAVVPVFEEISNRNVYQVGAAVHSNNLLQTQAYSLELTRAQNQLWFDFDYEHKSFFPGFSLGAFRQPSYFDAPVGPPADPVQQTFLLENAGVSLSIPIRLAYDRNIYNTLLSITPDLRVARFRAFNLDGTRASDTPTFPVAGLSASFHYRLQQNIRDLQPNSGLSFFGEMDQYLSSDRLAIKGASENVFALNRPYRIRGGVRTYLSPHLQWNQSLRVSIEAIQRSSPIFDNQFLVSEGFSGPVFLSANKLGSISTRYTIPVWFADDGGFLLPLYLSHIYLVGFSNTVTPIGESNILSNSRTVLGTGFRARFRISNLILDIGLAIGLEPSRNRYNLFMGNF